MTAFDTSLPVFLIYTVILFGFVAFMTASALAGTWRPLWLILPAAIVLAAANRLLGGALFQDPVLSLPGYCLVLAVLLLIMAVVYRMTLARKMVVQYPWLYDRSGLFGWRERT